MNDAMNKKWCKVEHVGFSRIQAHIYLHVKTKCKSSFKYEIETA